MKYSIISLAIGVSLVAQTPAIRLLKSLSGPSGKVVGNHFVFDETRNRFVFPQDKSLVIYFEWDTAPGSHVLTGLWKSPDGRTASISPDVKIDTETRELNSYWVYEIAPHMQSGIWTLEVRVDGQPAGSHSFELVIPESAKPVTPPGQPEPSRAPSLDEIYRRAGQSVMWIYKLNDAGRRADTALGFVIALDTIATAFQAIDSATALEIESPDGSRTTTKEVWRYNRLQDWALIKAPTGSAPPVELGDPTKLAVGQRLIVFNVEPGRARVIGGVDISGRRAVPPFGERIQLSPAPASEAAGGPLLDDFGRVVGIVGGSMAPGARFNRGNMGVTPGVWAELNANHAAIPISLLPKPPFPAAATIESLTAAGAWTIPVHPIPAFLYGGTTRGVTKKFDGTAPPDSSEFSKKDADVWVYVLMQRKEKVGKGMLSAKIYDATNRVRITVDPKKTSLGDMPSRSSFSFSPATLQPGIYRIDMLWDDQPFWRTFVTITE